LLHCSAPCNLHETDQDSTGVAARYSINIFPTYTKAGVRQHTQQPFLLGCTPTMLGTMMQTAMLNLQAHLSPLWCALAGEHFNYFSMH
jgi:hypothetical protein